MYDLSLQGEPFRVNPCPFPKQGRGDFIEGDCVLHFVKD